MRRIALALMLISSDAYGQALPVFNPTGPDAEAYGFAEHYPAGYPQTQRTLVGNFSHYDTIGHNRRRALSRLALSGQLFSGANRWAPLEAPPRPSAVR